MDGHQGRDVGVAHAPDASAERSDRTFGLRPGRTCTGAPVHGGHRARTRRYLRVTAPARTGGRSMRRMIHSLGDASASSSIQRAPSVRRDRRLRIPARPSCLPGRVRRLCRGLPPVRTHPPAIGAPDGHAQRPRRVPARRRPGRAPRSARAPSRSARSSVPRDELLLVHATGPRGDQARRPRTRQHPLAVQLGPYQVRGYLHAAARHRPAAGHPPPQADGAADRAVDRLSRPAATGIASAGRHGRGQSRADRLDHRRRRARRRRDRTSTAVSASRARSLKDFTGAILTGSAAPAPS